MRLRRLLKSTSRLPRLLALAMFASSGLAVAALVSQHRAETALRPSTPEPARVEALAANLQDLDHAQQEKAGELRGALTGFDFLVSRASAVQGLAEAWARLRDPLLQGAAEPDERQAGERDRESARIDSLLQDSVPEAYGLREKALLLELGKGWVTIRSTSGELRRLAGLRSAVLRDLSEKSGLAVPDDATASAALRHSRLFSWLALGLCLAGGACAWAVPTRRPTPGLEELVELARDSAHSGARRRASVSGEGALRELTIAFNRLLDRQEETESRLRTAQSSLELKVSARTAELWRANLALKTETEQRARTEHELYQAQKMDALGKLAGSIAHDFNNLLGVIIGGAESVHHQLPLNHAAQHLVGMILNAGQRAAELTQPLLTFSRNQVLTLESRDVNASAEETAMMLRRLLGPNVTLFLHLNPEPIGVKANGSQLSQIVMNLGVNARDAMAGIGNLTIHTAPVLVSAEKAIGQGVAAAGRWVRLSVSDTGSGMDAATKARIFEPFFTTKPAGQGTGLGLATVFGIVKQLNGFIEVESEPGLGSTFSVFLPALSAEEMSPASRLPAGLSTPAAHRAGGEETILLVDDEEDLLELASLTLESKGYRVLAAPNANEAILLAEKHRGEIRAVMTDVMMPGMNGVQFAGIVSRIIPGVRILFVSGHSNEIISSESLLAAHAEYLQKPYRSEDMAAKIREILERPETEPAFLSW